MELDDSATSIQSFDSCLWYYFVKVELIGYAVSNDELFLVYEYAQKGSLKSHLNDPQNKGTHLEDNR